MKFIYGIVSGVIIGLLVAPASGEKTRNKISNDMPKYKKLANDSLNDILDKARVAYSELANELNLYTEKKKNNSQTGKTATNVDSNGTATTANAKKNQ